MVSVNSKQLIRLSKSCLGELEKKAVLNVLEHEYLGMGKEVHDFERKLEKTLGRHVVCVSSGTAALHLALQAAGIEHGDEVLVQSLTYVASFQAISATGATPISCKVDPETLCLDWQDAENRITEKTKAIMPIHYSGGVGDLDGIYAFARKYNLRVIEDAAHAFGSYYKNKMVGSFGDVACFSFDGIKNITSGEGGCIVTNDEKILEAVRDARLLGVRKDTDKRYSGKRSWSFDVSAQGWRYHMSNIMAAIGIVQLNKLEDFSTIRRSLAKQYDKLLFQNPNIVTFKNNYNDIVPHIYVVRINDSINREDIRSQLSELNIETGIHYQPNHNLSLYDSINNKSISQDDIFQSILSLPLHADLTNGDIDYICREVNRITWKK